MICFTFTTNLTPEWQQKLAILETFIGRTFYKMPWESGPAQGGVLGMKVGVDAASQPFIHIYMNVGQLAVLDKAYSMLKESVYDALLPQTRLRPYLDDIGLTLSNGNFSLDFAALDTRLGTLHGSDANAAVGDLLDMRRLFGGTLEMYDWDGLSLLTDWVATDGNDAANDSKFEIRKLG